MKTSTRKSEAIAEPYDSENTKSYDIIVFCHLRWQFVYQRPQHIISRLSKKYKILLIEEPIGASQDQESSGDINYVSPNLHILQPKVNSIDEIAAILPEYVSTKSAAVGWFYSPSFSPLLQAMEFDTIVYDCMDELSLFKGAPQELINQEKYLMAHADIVFTGGKSLYESKTKLHGNVHCFPSSVDETHFAQALHGREVPSDINMLRHPVVGYFGVIDERIDLELLEKTAKSLPQIDFVMIGPLAKIHDSELPRAANIHYLGMKSYEELPQYLRRFDIAMMPFALNDATKFISPTKTLEYMAAGKPIISTKIKDVARDYSDCVHLIDSAAGFAVAILRILEQEDQSQTRERYREILRNTSWDTTVGRMELILKSYAS